MAEAGTNALECLQETEKSQSRRLYGRSGDERAGVSAGEREVSKGRELWRDCFRPAGRERVLKKCKKIESMRVGVVFPLTSAYLLFIILGLLKAIFVQAGQKYRACSIIGERV